MPLSKEQLITIGLGVAYYQSSKNRLKRKKWAKEWLTKRSKYTHINILNELRDHPDDWRNYMRMSEDCYKTLLELLTPRIQKQDTKLRDAISPHERLSATLRFLATGRKYEDLKFSVIISPQALSSIIPEVCAAIIQVLDNIKSQCTSWTNNGALKRTTAAIVETSGETELTCTTWLHNPGKGERIYLMLKYSASGFTEQMEKDLLTEMGINEEESNSDSGSDHCDAIDETREQSKANELEELREMVERTMLEDERGRNRANVISNKKENLAVNIVQDKLNERNTTVQCSKEEEGEKTNSRHNGMISPEMDVNSVSTQDDNSVKQDIHGSRQDAEISEQVYERLSNTDSQEMYSHNDIHYEKYDSDDDVKSVKTESDFCSVRSVSTTSTIPPEVIRSRVKKALEKREKAAARQRCLAKGEASAVTRKRRENRDTIKDCSGIWGWE